MRTRVRRERSARATSTGGALRARYNRAVRARLVGLGCLLMVACTNAPATSDVGTDAARVDANLSADAYAPGSPPPNITCGPDVSASLGFDPCLHWVLCVSDDADIPVWAVTFSNGACESGRCTFANSPVVTRCPVGCFLEGPTGRCVNPGMTAP